jgi:hypothetical protein
MEMGAKDCRKEWARAREKCRASQENEFDANREFFCPSRSVESWANAGEGAERIFASATKNRQLAIAHLAIFPSASTAKGG